MDGKELRKLVRRHAEQSRPFRELPKCNDREGYRDRVWWAEGCE